MRDKGKIKYLKGDATYPVGPGYKYIIHICNDIGAWGKRFVTAVSKRWSVPEKQYRKMTNKYLGEVEFVPFSEDIVVVNMIAQKGIRSKTNPSPISYGSLAMCLDSVAEVIEKYSLNNDHTVHMPRIGTGLAGGAWDLIEVIIQETLCDKGIDVYVYDLE